MNEVKFYLSLFLRRLHYFLLVSVVVSAVAVIAAMSLPPAYESQTRLLVEGPQIPRELASSTVNIGEREQLDLAKGTAGQRRVAPVAAAVVETQALRPFRREHQLRRSAGRGVQLRQCVGRQGVHRTHQHGARAIVQHDRRPPAQLAQDSVDAAKLGGVGGARGAAGGGFGAFGHDSRLYGCSNGPVTARLRLWVEIRAAPRVGYPGDGAAQGVTAVTVPGARLRPHAAVGKRFPGVGAAGGLAQDGAAGRKRSGPWRDRAASTC